MYAWLFRSVDGIVARWGEKPVSWFLLIAGAAARLAYVLHYEGLAPLSGDEPHRIAVAVATRGEFADAFGPGTGPTAHVGWLVVALPAAVYWIVGAGAPSAQAVLIGLSITVVSLSFRSCIACLGVLGVERPVRIVALAVLCLVPLQFELEGSGLRVWEAGLAAAALARILQAVLELDGREAPVSTRSVVPLAVAAAVLVVLNPASGLAAAAILSILIFRRGRPVQAVAALGSVLIVYGALTIPWDVRNRAVFGETAGTRSSLGIGLAVSYHDGVLDGSPQAAYDARMHAVHPDFPEGFARMRAAGGEIAYARQLKRDAVTWIRQHPLTTARIWLRNLRDFYFPPAWLWEKWVPHVGLRMRLQSATVSILSIAAFGVLLVALRRRRWPFIYPATAILALCPVYVIAFPLLRYRYPASSLMVALGVVGLAHGWRMAETLARAARHPDTDPMARLARDRGGRRA